MELARYSMAKYIENLNNSNTNISKIEFLKMLKDAVREVFILLFKNNLSNLIARR